MIGTIFEIYRHMETHLRVENLLDVMVINPVRILQFAQGYKHCKDPVSPPFDIDH